MRLLRGFSVRDLSLLAIGFIVWASIIATRSAYTHPYELLWFVGNVASGAAAFVLGRQWTKSEPARRARREKRHDGRL